MQALYQLPVTSPQVFHDYSIEMPHKTAPLTPRQKRVQQHEKTRKILAGANLRTDDSDDEDEYEWIYEDGDEDGDGAASKPKRQSAANKIERTIVGAKRGNFKCMIGDSVLLKAEDGNPPWVGMILSFLEDEDGDMAADFLCTVKENPSEGEGLTHYQGSLVRRRLSTRRRRDPTSYL